MRSERKTVDLESERKDRLSGSSPIVTPLTCASPLLSFTVADAAPVLEEPVGTKPLHGLLFSLLVDVDEPYVKVLLAFNYAV